MNMRSIASSWLCIGVLWAALGAQAAQGQSVTQFGPAYEQELITLSRGTPFDQVIRLIQTFSPRVIIYPQNIKTPLSINMDRLPWQRALSQVALLHGLQLVERQDIIELVRQIDDQQASSAPVEAKVRREVNLDTREINIAATFFQADRRALRQLGIDWSTLSGGVVEVQAGRFGSGTVTGNGLVLGGTANITRSLSVDALLQAFESENTGEIVANPQVKVRSGKVGYIQVGSDFSVTTADFAGNAITQFFSTGTILTVTPTLIVEEEKEFINIEVEAERSSLVDPVRNLINKTVARTTALLKDGEQTAIGGLFGHEVTINRTGVPFLKDLPGWFFGLRYLFGSDSHETVKTDLVVLIKVNVVPTIRERLETRLKEESPRTIFEQKKLEFDVIVDPDG